MPEGDKLKRIPLCFVILTTFLSFCVSSPLCENRCEKANPRLHRLKSIWTLSVRRRSLTGVTFQDFIRSLISAADDRERMGPLRSALLGMVGNYRDCIVACEHQFSKRGSPQPSDDHYEDHSRLSILCNIIASFTSHQLSQEIISYCRPYKDLEHLS